MKRKQEEILEDFSKRSDLSKLEKFYVESKLENLPLIVEERKNNIVKEIEEYKIKNREYTTNKNGEIVEGKVNTPPYVISSYFFRSITNLQNIEPEFNGEKLSILWDLYDYLVIQVNLNLCEFTPTLSHFCKFIGISLAGFKKLRNMGDEGTRIVVDKICDNLYDNSTTMAELNKHNTRATIYRMKSELERTEKEQPNVSVKIVSTPNIDEINKRLSELTQFSAKSSGDKYAN